MLFIRFCLFMMHKLQSLLLLLAILLLQDVAVLGGVWLLGHEHAVRLGRVLDSRHAEAHRLEVLLGRQLQELAHVRLGLLVYGRHEWVHQQVLEVLLVEVQQRERTAGAKDAEGLAEDVQTHPPRRLVRHQAQRDQILRAGHDACGLGRGVIYSVLAALVRGLVYIKRRDV